MMRTAKYALSAVLATVMVAPAMAQDNFPDVPDNHWAFEALARMKKEGILVGYPDGLFRGGRPASRYELAVAINAAYTNLKNITDGLQSQIDAIKAQPQGDGGASKADVQSLRDALTALQNEVATLRGLRDDVSNLRRMADTFQKELQQLGVDVEAMKRDLGDLADRVTKLEQKKPAVDISGDVNLWLGAGNSRDNRYGLDMDGRINGTTNAQNPNIGTNVGLSRDLTILHEAGITLAGTNETGPQWKGTLVFGNTLANADAISGLPTTRRAFGNQSQLQSGFGYAEGPGDVYLNDFSVKFTTSVAGLGFNAEVGRVGYKVNPYMFQRIDNTSYYSNERWDNGEYTFDGAVLGFNLGGAKIDVVGGRNSDRLSTNGVELNPTMAGRVGGPFGFGALNIDRTLGVNANVPLSTAGNLNLAYLWLESDNYTGVSQVSQANRANVFGGSADFNIGRIKLEGGFFQTNLSANETNVIDSENTAFYAGASYAADRFNLFAKYREIEANYVAPGDWGRLGILRNPTNIKGFEVGGKLDVTSGIAISAKGEFYQGLDNAFANTTGFGEGTDINKFAVDLSYKVNANTSVWVGYENTEFENLVNPSAKVLTGNPRYRWTTFGVGYGLSDAAKLMIQYQISDVENEYQIPGIGTRFSGGLLTTQLSVKF
jgi:hypothetical protein